jgi:hypothetical protein
MRKYLEYLAMIATTCGIISGAAIFSWNMWAIPATGKFQEKRYGMENK